MTRPFVVGLTGGIASGKSMVAGMLRDMGYALVNIDLLAHGLYEPGTPCFHRIVDTFGKVIIGPDLRIDRKKLGTLVFADRQALSELDLIMTEPLRNALWSEITTRNEGLVIAEGALIIENALLKECDLLLVVYVPREIQLDRLIRRENFPEATARKRIDSQLDIEEKRKRADLVIDNSQGIEQTRGQVLAVSERLDFFCRK